MGGSILPVVGLLSWSTLRDFAERYPDAEAPLAAWAEACDAAAWATPTDVKAFDRRASFVGSDRVVFNIGGNKFRVIVRIAYPAQLVFVCFVGTHAEYDKVDAATVRQH
jgi:mRNA interferase HigB